MAATYIPDELANIAYQQAHPEDDRRYQIITSCAICFAASVVAVAVRLWARRLARAGLGIDDYMIVAALFFFAVLSTSAILTTTYGMARHLIYVTKPEGLGITSIISESMYNFVVGSTKLSVLAFYGRLFPQRYFPMRTNPEVLDPNNVFALGTPSPPAHVTLTMDNGQWTNVKQLSIGKYKRQIEQDRELEMQHIKVLLESAFTMPGSCIDFWTGALAGTIFNVITDVITLTLPVPLIWKLKVDRRRRLQLVLAFTIGGVACIASIVRGFYTPELFAFDTTWEFVGIIVATEVELMMFIISACIPTYATLFKRYRNQQSQTSRQSMPSSFPTKRSHSTFELSGGSNLQKNRWSTLDTNNSEEEKNDKQIMITTAISTISDLPKQEDFKLANAL